MNDRGYVAAVEDAGRVLVRDCERAEERCRSILLTHGVRAPRATLFLHGMTASPRQFDALAAYAHLLGDNVFVPRMPKHGYPDRLTGALGDLRASELLETVERSVTIARGLGERVRVVGFSLGGLLAAWVAQHYDVDEAIALSPLLGLAVVPPALTRRAVAALRMLPNHFFWWNPLKRAKLMPAHGYPRFSTHALAEALSIGLNLFVEARERGPRSRITLVTNAGEFGVSNRAVSQLEALWRAAGGARVERLCIGGLGPSHDIVEPLREGGKAEKSYPFFFRLLDAATRTGADVANPSLA